MTPLITANQLEEIINSGENVLLCDCRFDLADTSAGRKAYEESHVPGAIYVDLDQDLSGEKTEQNGRHPLPTPDAGTCRHKHNDDLCSRGQCKQAGCG